MELRDGPGPGGMGVGPGGMGVVPVRRGDVLGDV